MSNQLTDIQDRLFTCVNRCNFRLIARSIAEWELMQPPYLQADNIRAIAIQILSECYEEMKAADEYTTECSQIAGGLVAICHRLEGGDLHFQLEFVLHSATSQDENISTL